MAVFKIRHATLGLSDRATLMFLKFDMPQGHKSHSDMRNDHLLNSTGDMGINKRQRQRHATLAFLKIERRHGHSPSRAPNWTCQLREQPRGGGKRGGAIRLSTQGLRYLTVDGNRLTVTPPVTLSVRSARDLRRNKASCDTDPSLLWRPMPGSRYRTQHLVSGSLRGSCRK